MSEIDEQNDEPYRRAREEVRREWEQVHAKQQRALVQLARRIHQIDLTQALAAITEAAAHAIDVARVSVWLYDAAQTSIRCEDLLERGPGTHSRGQVLSRSDYPGYFAALEESRAVVAHDAHTDPATAEFSAGYLTPLGIGAMLDAPIRRGDRVVGVLCHEHVGPARSWTVEDVSFAGSLADLVAIAFEQQDLQRAQSALRESEERYALAAQGANDGLWDWNLRTNEAYYSPRFREITGMTPEVALTQGVADWFARVHPDDLPHLSRALRAMLDGTTGTLANEHRIAFSDGSERWVESRAAAVRDEHNKPLRVAGSLTDISVRKAYEAQLLHDAFHDGLTRLPNRALFLDRLGRLLERGRRHRGNRCAVLLVDADRFKVINESLGHRVGDELLIALAEILQKCLRPTDTLARLGGDEFGVLIEDVRDASEAIEVADRVLAELSEPIKAGTEEVFAAVSIGIAVSTPEHQRAEDLLRDADVAMYRAKNQGRGRHELFEGSTHVQATELLRLHTDLRRALKRNELVLHYQPIIALDKGTICGLEALVRWRHPSRGMVPPGDFIGLAEETGLIFGMGQWILEEACRQGRELSDRFPGAGLDMSVNVSPRQLAQGDVVDQVARVLKDTGFEPERLHLEITESTLMEDAENAKERLRKLRSLGVGVRIDDFGTGYSSLSALHTFPIDTLKIDRSFVVRLEDEGYSAAIVEAIVTVARRLGIRVIAEGIQTERQLVAVREHGCHEGQGFFFARPTTLEEIAGLLQSAPHW